MTYDQVKEKLPVFNYSKKKKKKGKKCGLWVKLAHLCKTNLVHYSRDMLKPLKDIFSFITNIVLMTEEAQSQLHNFLN